MSGPGEFPGPCICPLDRRSCTQNLTTCDIAWAVAYRRSVRPSLLDRLAGFLTALAWWHR